MNEQLDLAAAISSNSSTIACYCLPPPRPCFQEFCDAQHELRAYFVLKRDETLKIQGFFTV
jgi:hypothetical protein